MMKKIFTIIIMFMFMITVKAASFSLSVSCPSTASPGEIISCSLTANATGFDMGGVQVSYSFTNATFNSFTASSIFDSKLANNEGGSAFRCDPRTGTAAYGTLKAKMPATGTATIVFSNIKGATSDYVEYNGSNVTKTIRVKSSDNTLSNLTVSGVTLSPTFSSSNLTYTGTTNESSVTITATKSNNYASVSGAGNKTLNYGNNKFDIVVTAEDGTKKTYSITINRPDNREDVNTLSSITLSDGTLSPNFTSGTLTYTAKVSATVTKVTINSIKTSNKSSYVNGYGNREVNLEYGENKVLIKVLSEKGNEKIYSLYITRPDNRSVVNNLKTLTLSEGNLVFNKNTLDYSLTVNYDVEKVTIGGSVEDTKSKVTGLGEKTLSVGKNVFDVVVTAENTKTKTYKITIIRLSEAESPSSNTDFKSLLIAGHEDLTFLNEKTEYDIKLDDNENILNFSYSTEDEKSIVSITGNENLHNGSVVTVSVKSTDGTIKTYKFNIIKSGEVSNTSKKSETAKKEPYKITTGLIIAIVSILVIIGTIITAFIVNKKRKQKIETLEL